MNKPSTSPGPVFRTVKAQPHPDHHVHDLGLQMQWHNRKARLYRAIRPHAPQSFNSDDVMLHEEDVPEGFDYYARQARQTAVGMFYGLSPYLVAINKQGYLLRDVYTVLTDLDALLPPDRPQPKPMMGRLVADLEIKGYRLSKCIPSQGRAMLDIGWQPKPDARVFFTGVIEMRGNKAQWMTPNAGVNQLLQPGFENICPDPANCLTPVGIDYCIGQAPYGMAKPAKHDSSWTRQPQSPSHVQSSSKN